jgi:hypothetical protein
MFDALTHRGLRDVEIFRRGTKITEPPYFEKRP